MKFVFQITVLLTLIYLLFVTCNGEQHYKNELQVTHDLSYNHDLDNNDNFSPDDQWLVYDTRTEAGGIGACSKIEKVHVATGDKVVLYELKQNQSFGPGVGAVSYSHTENQVCFIHGLMNITAENPYQQWRRSGVIVADREPGAPVFMDSRDVTPPFTPGALRGGTHRHEWSRDGGWVGFTYNDAILKHLEDSTGETHNLRTIGVSKLITPPLVDEDNAGENINGQWFSSIVVEVVANPVPGSDEISRAAGDSWVGISGYKNGDRALQRARAFIGTTRNKLGQEVDEVYIVDIPDDISKEGDGPLEGAATSMPAPPKGSSQRRLTFTSNWKNPGCVGIVRSSADGSHLAFRAYDNDGVLQVFTISPLGGEPVQQTFHESDVQSGVRWHPSESKICYIWDNSMIMQELGSTTFERLTEPTSKPPTDPVWSHDGKMIAYNRLVENKLGQSTKQIFILWL